MRFAKGVGRVVILPLLVLFLLMLPSVLAQETGVLRKGLDWEDVWCVRLNATHRQCMRMAGGGINNVPNQYGELEKFTDVYSMAWQDGQIKVSWWDGFFGIRPSVIYNGNEYSIAQIKQAYPSISMKNFIYEVGVWKYGFNFSGINETIVDNVDFIKFQLGDTSGLSWSDVRKSDGKIFVKDKLVLDFNDLKESGFILNLVNKTTLLISNVSGKTNFSLDPTISPQPAGVTGIDTKIKDDDKLHNFGLTTAADIGIAAGVTTKNFYRINWSGIGLTTINVSSIDGLNISIYILAKIESLNLNISQMFTCWDEGTGTADDGNASWYANSTGGRLWNGGVAGTDYNVTAMDVQTPTAGSFLNLTVTPSIADSQFKGDRDCGFIVMSTSPYSGHYITTLMSDRYSTDATTVPIYFIIYTEVVPNTPPMWNSSTNNASTVTKKGSNWSVGVNLLDDSGLDFAYSINNGSGDFRNYTLIDLGDVASIVLNETNITWNVHNDYVCGRYWFNDTDGESNESGNSCFVVANSVPVAENITIDPSPAGTGDDLNCTYDFFDVDGGSEADQWFLWFVNDVLNTNTTQVLGSGNTSATDEVICSVIVNDGIDNSSWSNSSVLVIADSTVPVLENLSVPSSGHSDTDINISADCVDTDNTSSIDYVKVEIRYPTASGLSPTNFSMSLLSGNMYNKTFLPSYVGTYNFSFFCKDSSGNEKTNFSTQNGLSFVSSSPPSPPSLDGGTTGGGGIIETIEIIVNVSSILDFGISRSTFTVFTAPSTDKKIHLVKNIGDKDFKGIMIVPPALQEYLDFSVCDEFGECFNESVEIAQGETKYLIIIAEFTRDLGLGAEGFLQFKDDDDSVHSLEVVIDRPPLYTFYSRIADNYFRGDEKTALLVVYTVTAFSIIGAFALALMWV